MATCAMKIIIWFFTRVMVETGLKRSLYRRLSGPCIRQRPLNALPSLHLLTCKLYLSSGHDLNYPASMFCLADLTLDLPDNYGLFWWSLDSTLNLVAVTDDLYLPLLGTVAEDAACVRGGGGWLQTPCMVGQDNSSLLGVIMALMDSTAASHTS